MVTSQDKNQHDKKSELKYLWAFLFLVIGSVGVIGGCTQYVANAYQYHPGLGQPLFSHVYAPWKIVSWAYNFWDYAPDLFQNTIIVLYVQSIYVVN